MIRWIHDFWQAHEAFLTFWGLRILVVVGLFLVVRFYLRRIHHRWFQGMESRLGTHNAVMIKRFTAYGVWLLWGAVVLVLFGVNLEAMVAGLGLFSVAIGFAAQKSVSNLISGLFILFDRPFEIGDFVDIGGTSGTVMFIDLLSTRLRTPDNLLVRIPNETVLGSVIKNYTHFDIRRLTLSVGVSYNSNLVQVQDVIRKVLDHHPMVLADPAPRIILKEMADSSINFEIWVWVERSQLFEARTDITRSIKEALDQAGIEIPFPQRVVHLRANQ